MNESTPSIKPALVAPNQGDVLFMHIRVPNATYDRLVSLARGQQTTPEKLSEKAIMILCGTEAFETLNDEQIYGETETRAMPAMQQAV